MIIKIYSIIFTERQPKWYFCSIHKNYMRLNITLQLLEQNLGLFIY